MIKNDNNLTVIFSDLPKELSSEVTDMAEFHYGKITQFADDLGAICYLAKFKKLRDFTNFTTEAAEFLNI